MSGKDRKQKDKKPGDDLDALESRLSDLRARTAPPAAPAEQGGMKAGAELVGGTLGGALIGYLIDQGFGTAPFGMIVMLLLGVCTGFYNIYKITLSCAAENETQGLPNEKKQDKRPQNQTGERE